tara:strand:- start:2075 stop:2743 length:669 start_codon:yes stop_codon:yes gene_type:complete
MDQLLDKKSQLNNNLNDILSILNNIDINDNYVIDELNNKNKILNESNTKLINEIKEKDKIITMNQKTICDYEKQINSFNEEQEQSNKFDMVKAKDKEIHEQNKTIEILRKELDNLKKKSELLSDKNISCDIQDVTEVVKECIQVTPVSEPEQYDENIKEKEEEEESDEQLEAETVIWRKKEYYLIEEDGKNKVFEITDDDDIGKEVGLWIDNKLVRPDKKNK